MEPKLFLDVDGCLLVHKDPGGYVSFERNGETFWYHPDTPKRIQAADVIYDIYWSSHSWRGADSKFLASLFEIKSKQPDLDFEVAEENRDENMWPEKLVAIRKLSDDHPVAIIDDRMGPAVEEWASDKVCILIQPDKHVGLTEDEFNLLMSFGELHNTKDELVKDFLEAQAEDHGLVFSNGEWF